MTNTARSITEKVNADALTSAQQRQQKTVGTKRWARSELWAGHRNFSESRYSTLMTGLSPASTKSQLVTDSLSATT